MKVDCHSALSKRAPKRKRQWLTITHKQQSLVLPGLYREDVDIPRATAKHKETWIGATIEEGGARHAQVVTFQTQAGNDLQTRNVSCHATDGTLSSRRKLGPSFRWLLRSLFLTFSLLMNGGPRVCTLPGGTRRALVACAVSTTGQNASAEKGTFEAQRPGNGTVFAEDSTQYKPVSQGGKKIFQIDKEQRRTVLLGLKRHQRIWPTFAHGKSKRGSVVVYRPIPPEAANEVYDVRSDLIMDAVLLEHLLQTLPPDTGFLLVIDLRHVADHIRASLAPRNLAGSHTQSSLMNFAKSLQWQSIRIIFLRTLCEGVILINAPAIVQQVQPILEFLLFNQRPGLLREDLASDNQKSPPTQSNRRYILHVSQDEKALHAAVDVSELPPEYAERCAVPTRITLLASREPKWLRKDPVHPEHGEHALSSPYKLGDAPEHLAFSDAISATLLELDAGETPFNTLATRLPTSTGATSEVQRHVKEQQQGGHLSAPASRLDFRNDVRTGEAVPEPEDDTYFRNPFSIAPFQEKKSYAIFGKHHARGILLRVPQTRAVLGKGGRPSGGAGILSDPFSTTLRGEIMQKPSHPDVRGKPGQLLRSDSSMLVPHLVQALRQPDGLRHALLQQREGLLLHQKDADTSAQVKRTSPAQRHSTRTQPARTTKEGAFRASRTDRADIGEPANGRSCIGTPHSRHSKQTGSVQRQKPIVSSAGRHRAQHRPVLQKARGHLFAAAARETRDADKWTGSRNPRGTNVMNASTGKAHLPEETTEKQASEESHRQALAMAVWETDAPAVVRTSPNASGFDVSYEEGTIVASGKNVFKACFLHLSDPTLNHKRRVSPQAARSIKSVQTGEEEQTTSSDSVSNGIDETPFLSPEPTRVENARGHFKFLRGSGFRIRPRTSSLNQKRWPQQGNGTDFLQNGRGGLLTTAFRARYSLNGQEEASGDKDFDDIS